MQGKAGACLWERDSVPKKLRFGERILVGLGKYGENESGFHQIFEIEEKY